MWEPAKILDMFNCENLSDLSFYSNCFNESLRMQPPVYYSSSVCMKKDLEAGGVKIRAGDAILINMHLLGRNPKEWQEPEMFLPERFDSESKYFATPDGKRRNPYSFSPFLGGQRICLGKSFVE